MRIKILSDKYGTCKIYSSLWIRRMCIYGSVKHLEPIPWDIPGVCSRKRYFQYSLLWNGPFQTYALGSHEMQDAESRFVQRWANIIHIAR